MEAVRDTVVCGAAPEGAIWDGAASAVRADDEVETVMVAEFCATARVAATSAVGALGSVARAGAATTSEGIEVLSCGLAIAPCAVGAAVRVDDTPGAVRDAMFCRAAVEPARWADASAIGAEGSDPRADDPRLSVSKGAEVEAAAVVRLGVVAAIVDCRCATTAPDACAAASTAGASGSFIGGRGALSERIGGALCRVAAALVAMAGEAVPCGAAAPASCLVERIVRDGSAFEAES